MGLYEHIISSEDDPWNTLWDNGEFLTNLKLIDKSFSHYAFNKFFVELGHTSVSDKI